MKKLICLVLLSLSISVHAQDYNIGVKGGIGVFNSGKPYLSAVRFFAVDCQMPLWKSIVQQIEFGGFLDAAGNGRKSSAVAAYQVGPRLNYSSTYVEFLTGIGVLGAPDTMLGGPFQFFHDIGMGFQDKQGFGIGIGYKHISSAGIESPNRGRDMVYFKITIPLKKP